MSVQEKDPFLWDGKEYIFTAAEDVYSLFDPEKFGLKPESTFTGCWKGFVVYFEVKAKQLYLKHLSVHCEDEHYPAINGVEAGEADGLKFHFYKDINLPLSYSGKIIIGDELQDRYEMRCFTGPHSYERTYDLIFEQGVLKSYQESTGKYHGI